MLGRECGILVMIHDYYGLFTEYCRVCVIKVRWYLIFVVIILLIPSPDIMDSDIYGFIATVTNILRVFFIIPNIL